MLRLCCWPQIGILNAGAHDMSNSGARWRPGLGSLGPNVIQGVLHYRIAGGGPSREPPGQAFRFQTRALPRRSASKLTGYPMRPNVPVPVASHRQTMRTVGVCCIGCSTALSITSSRKHDSSALRPTHGSTARSGSEPRLDFLIPQ